jgi:hypothetical protein
MIKLLRRAFVSLFVFLVFAVEACQCPPSVLSLKECEKYEIIFKGKVVSAKTCDTRPGEAIFEVSELFKGNTEKKFRLYFTCKDDCAREFAVGDEWIIYTRYKQIDNAQMDWCSRSRKYFRFDKEDYYTELYGNDYDDELTFLRSTLGNHRVMEKKQVSEERNKKPNVTESIYILISSLGAIILFYFLINRFLK